MTIRTEIRILRNNSGLSQEEFGTKIGFSQGYVSDVESGRTKPSEKMIRSIRREFGITTSWALKELIKQEVDDIIEYNRSQTISPQSLIYIYGFNEKEIEESERILLKSILGKYDFKIVNAEGVNSDNKLLEKILDKKGSSHNLWESLKNLLLNDGLILIIKNISLSKIQHKGLMVRSIFKILDEERINPPTGTLILLDYPSFLEKNTDFGYYARPIYLLQW
jgi:transcriptional regulator with XRE-family HTH domain